MERKFVVKIIDEIPGCAESEITQTYLMSEPGTEIRLRKRGSNGTYVYVQTTKKKVSSTEYIETERQITPQLYVQLLQQADPKRQSIRKIRKNFMWNKRYYELDTYVSPSMDLNILELDGKCGSQEVELPPFLKLVEDVTGNTDYFSINIALKK